MRELSESATSYCVADDLWKSQLHENREYCAVVVVVSDGTRAKNNALELVMGRHNLE